MSASNARHRRARQKVRQQVREVPIHYGTSVSRQAPQKRPKWGRRQILCPGGAYSPEEKAEHRDIVRRSRSTLTGGVAVLDDDGRVIFVGSRRDAELYLGRYGHREHCDVEIIQNRGYVVGDWI